MNKKQHNFWRFLQYVRPYWKYVAVGVIGGIVKFTLPLLIPLVTQHLLDHVYLNPALTLEQKLHELFLMVGGLMLIFVCIYAPFTYFRHFCTGKAGHQSVFDLRCDLYYQILRMSASFFQQHKSGGIVARLINDVALAQNLVGSALTNVWMDTVAIVVVLFFLFRINVPLTFVALSTFPLYLYLLKKLGRQIRISSHRVQEELENISGNVQEKVAGNIIVQAFNQEEKEMCNFNHDSERLLGTSIRSLFLHSLNMTMTGTLTKIAPLLVTLFGGYQVIRGRMTVGGLIAAGMYLNHLYFPLERFSELNVVFANSMAALDRIFEIMDQQPEIISKPGAPVLPELAGEVQFEKVSFAYNPDHPVLHNISFTVHPGEQIALVGPSGSGKTTIVNLIPRFYDVTSGAIRVDGYDIREVNLPSLRRQVGMVLQDPVLFSGTIRDNILYGNPQASKEELLQAAEAANALDFISTLPHGFNTEVGERGTMLSGGQKQRLTIARAFLKNPRILILDEATSALDSESENLIQEALERLMVGRTTFIIAHRLSTVMNADRILVVSNGRIIEHGTHAELIALRGAYYHLYTQQYGADDPSPQPYSRTLLS